ncbi:MAG: N-6 DNA methylase [Candidatus Eisenbacteria sp.]|nr:N-6 DNA methylase [Candidatus Eisenbacteria bacterium]
MAKLDPAILAHLEWLGFVQPTGLVVSAPALVRAGAILGRRDAEGQRLLRACIEERVFDPKEGPTPWIPHFRVFAEQVLGWSFSPKGYAGTAEAPVPAELEVPLPEYSETLRPDFAVRELESKDGASPWQLLVRVLEPGEDFDRAVRGKGGLEASAHGRMERLLRRTGVHVGLIFNGRALRLLSAPRGESSGWLDFRVTDMVQTAGRPVSTALRLLLGQTRLLSLPRAKRLAALLEDSRKFQNEVSERLAEQVLHALYELLRGFQAAHDASKGELLHQPLAEHPDEVYRALLTVLLRLVFLLYAEERDMLPGDETFVRYYSLAGLYDRLREDAALFPDTMDQRYGAWAQLLVLFRMIHDGADCGAMRLPKRHGVLFDPDRFKFLEGRLAEGARQIHERIEAPLVPDGTIYRALEKLLVLDGERISYRALDVEQIGSVYETIMGFRLETATGRSAAIKAAKKHGAPSTVDLEALLEEPAAKRKKWIQDHADRKLTDRVHKAVKEAATLDELHAALEPVLDKDATPDLVPEGAMVLQPSEERRRSGSHYTPRALTEPIVRTTLEPILARLRGEDGRPPEPAQILDLKVCDPAMGSGAFLVEACRQLGDALIEAWHAHDAVPAIPADEDEVVFARRLIAQRCLYGVDKNPVAVDLAKVSLWLVTLAKDHALTFVDHALRHGDSLVGLSRKQIEAFHWDPDAPRFQAGFETMQVREQVRKVADLRQRIRQAGAEVSSWVLRDLWDEAQFELGKVRLFGDLAIAALFEVIKPKEREVKRGEYANAVVSGEAECYRAWLEEWRYTDRPLAPFHWEIEFPEVFELENPGFDAIVGNPPFLGGRKLSTAFGRPYAEAIRALVLNVKGSVNLVGYFLVLFGLRTREQGHFGLVATSSIVEGETRSTTLRPMLLSRYSIIWARSKAPWPGQAGVHIVQLSMKKGQAAEPFSLDGQAVDCINSRLECCAEPPDPVPLVANKSLHSDGVKVQGIGFVLSDKEAKELVLKDKRSSAVVWRYVTGDDLNSLPHPNGSRWIINFWDMSESEARVFVEPFRIVEERVKPYRDSLTRQVHEPCFWKFWDRREDFFSRCSRLQHVVVMSKLSKYRAVTFGPVRNIYSEKVKVFASDDAALFGILQSQAHDSWSLREGATTGETPAYSGTKCFGTFPLPLGSTYSTLRGTATECYEHREAYRRAHAVGLTESYNRFHDPDERDPVIDRLRELHAAMDRAVLDAYGWSDIPTDCEFLLDYEIDEEDAGSRRKKPWRYRWPDPVRDEVLARLLELNAERAREEARSGVAKTKKRSGKGRTKRGANTSHTGDLFS